MSTPILFVSPELAPYHQPSHCGEVVTELAVALRSAGHTVAAIAPYCKSLQRRSQLARRLRPLDIRVGEHELSCTLYEGQLEGKDIPAWFVDIPLPADASAATHALGLAKATMALLGSHELNPAIVHCVEWQTGFVPKLLREDPRFAALRTVFSVFTPAETGCFPSTTLGELGLGYEDFTPEGIEFHGQASLLKAGIVYADHITTASEAMREALQREPFGAGLHGLYAAKASRLSGILPGVEPIRWSPERDHRIAERYSGADLAGKAACKADLQRHVELAARSGSAIVVVPYESAPLLLETHDEWFERKVQLVFCGTAEPALAKSVEELRHRAPGRIGFASGQGDAWRKAIAGADGLWLGSGALRDLLWLLKAHRYGTVPIAARCGHLEDVLVDIDTPSRSGNAFCFEANNAPSAANAMRRFLDCFESKEVWTALQRPIMNHPYTATLSAARHGALYGLLADPAN